ncbi:23S rRNA (uracil(1939)-C(5))-methyltransferase RlmD [candidate division KSB3 bacterium]|uniref:23S rRNA (Uracil(1939)-C(5))-methyltransferase RlmD n=1 Tax=candidate division KSB3 bacterium TaxID=2044937 RepID=A0A2G6E908_9BACT|nr:MAG: 23S rRNA (uracil(1939)-C(5))-methyltransferase RlmD [candidate division KSB3 bacterium]PIE29524.1 MAG: 23S rRNA (uracil(1939)-C(5))-methyltransferase RlmD [candidate division KSB3 bacterium]
MHIGDRIELTLETLALGGEAIARIDKGLVVFVRGGIPGDRGIVEIVKRKRKFATGTLVELLEPSPIRIEARCENFGRCGGCKWQYLNYEDQLRFKQQQVIEAFRHIGQLREIDVNDIIGMEFPWYYRNKMEFSFGQDEEDGLILGQHYAGRWDKKIDIRNCYLQSKDSVDIFALCRDFARRQQLTVFSSDTEEGLLRHLIVREGKHTGDIMVHIVTSGEYFPQLDRFVRYLTAGMPRIKSIVHTINRRKGQSSQGQEEILLYGEATIRENINGLSFNISAQSFFQTNSRQTEILYQTIQRMAEVPQGGTVVDLYCGTGSIALHVASQAGMVYGIELVEDSILNARKNAELNNIENVEFHCGEVQNVMPTLGFEQPNVMVADPPRAGLSKKVVGHILKADPRQIIYVSCNPATLARDVAMILNGGYTIREIQPIDMFPHTYHIETVVNLMK